MKTVSGKIVSSRRPNASDEDWDEADCLCQKKIPEDKRIEMLIRKFDEKRQKWRWKAITRHHQDCPIHGCHRSK